MGHDGVARLNADGSGKATEGAVPADMEGPAATAREALIEMVAEADDALMERFFDAGTLTQEELLKEFNQTNPHQITVNIAEAEATTSETKAKTLAAAGTPPALFYAA